MAIYTPKNVRLVSGHVFLVSGLVFWMSGHDLSVSGLVVVWTCIFDVLELYFGRLEFRNPYSRIIYFSKHTSWEFEI